MDIHIFLAMSLSLFVFVGGQGSFECRTVNCNDKVQSLVLGIKTLKTEWLEVNKFVSGMSYSNKICAILPVML